MYVSTLCSVALITCSSSRYERKTPRNAFPNVAGSTRKCRQNRCRSGLLRPPSWTLLHKPSASRWNRRQHGSTPKHAKFTSFSTCFGAASPYQQCRLSMETTRDLACDLRLERRDAMRKDTRTGRSWNQREARRLTRVETDDAESRFDTRFSMLFDMVVDPAPRCMSFGAVRMRMTCTGMLGNYRHSEIL